MQETIIFLTAIMAYWVPPPHNDTLRYEQIASDALAVASEKNWIGLSPEETAGTILAIASFESGFRADIDRGIVRGDGGKSVCLGQVQAATKIDREHAATDRKTCFRTMLTKIDQSWRWCARLPYRERLSGYTVGRCVPSRTSRTYSKRILEVISAIHELLPDPDIDMTY